MLNNTPFPSIICFIVINLSLIGGQKNRICERRPPGTILPSPVGCELYLECIDGVAETFYCQKNYFYSAANPPCDIAERTNCTSTKTPRESASKIRPTLATSVDATVEMNVTQAMPTRHRTTHKRRTRTPPMTMATSLGVDPHSTTYATTKKITKHTRRTRPTSIVPETPEPSESLSTTAEISSPETTTAKYTKRPRRTRRPTPATEIASTTATTISEMVESLATTQVNNSSDTTTPKSSKHSRRTRTTPTTIEITSKAVITTTLAVIETATEVPLTTQQPKPTGPLERGIKCPENETADGLILLPSNMDCTK